MMHTPSRAVVLTVVAASLALIPAIAEGQIGGFIKKKVGEQVADKVLGGQQGSREPAFSDRILEIDADRLARFVRGIDAEVSAHQAAMAPFRDYEAKMTAHRKAVEEKARCEQEATAEYNTMAVGLAGRMTPGGAPAAGMTEFHQRLAALPEKERKALMERAEWFAKQIGEANDRGDTQSAMRIGAAAQADMEKTVGLPMPVPGAASAGGGRVVSDADARRMEAISTKMEADLAKCPKSVPPEPDRPEGYGRSNYAQRDTIVAAAVRASGMTAPQFAMMRERVTGWLAQRASKPGAYVFTASETATLEAREQELARREKAILGQHEGGGWRF